MAKYPLPGQGKPLPADWPFAGEWLFEGKLFLYRTDHQRQLSRQEMQATYASASGVNAVRLARRLRMDVEELFEKNRRQALKLVDVRPTAHGPRATRAYILYFQVETTVGSLVVEWDDNSFGPLA
jgi:hypothetical protein